MIGPSKKIFQQSEEESNAQIDEQRQNDNQIYREQFYNDQQQEKSFKQLLIPVQNYASLKGHKKAISCVCIEPKGHRMASGSLDYHVRLWDFHGMNKNMNSFRIIQPFTCNAIRNLYFNRTGTHLMVINGGKQITMLDRDGARSLLTVKGYMYVKELHQTKGHTNTIYSGQFHPENANQFVSCSGDGSLRLWDLQQKLEGIEQQLAHKTLIKCKNSKGSSIGITNVCYLNQGKQLAAGCLDGSLQIFSTKKNLHRPEILIRDAHSINQQYTGLISFRNDRKIISRNSDHSLKMWDLRMFVRPITYYSNLPNYFPGSKICFSPDEKYLLAGTSIGIDQDQKQGYLHFFDTINYDKVKTINMGSNSVTGIAWSPILNQIVTGFSNGQARIFFDQTMSIRGALKSIVKQPRVDKDPSFDYSHPIYLPHSLPIYKQRPTNNIKKDLVAIRKDPILSHKPFLPQQGPHKGGRQNDVAYTQIHHVIQSLNANPEKVIDSRKPLWQLQKYTKQKQQYTQAYQLTQPKQIYNDNPTEEKEFQFLQKIQKICPHCGLKLCTCGRKDNYDSQDQAQRQQYEK